MQNIFPKIDKKLLMIMGVILIVALIASFFIYKYLKDIEKVGQNKTGEVKIETPSEQTIIPNQNQEQPQVEIKNPQIEKQPQPGFTVCVDKCGDGVCQPAGTICKDNLNCICAETKTDCPSDCK